MQRMYTNVSVKRMHKLIFYYILCYTLYVILYYTGNVLTSEIYTLAYYQSVAREAVAAGAHMIGIKDMAGLLRPLEAGIYCLYICYAMLCVFYTVYILYCLYILCYVYIIL